MTDNIFQELASSGVSSQLCTELQAQHTAKHYHQVIESSFEILIQNPDIKPTLCLKFFNEVMKPIGTKLNPVRFMELTGLVLRKGFCYSNSTNSNSNESPSTAEKLSFLEDNFVGMDATDYLSIIKEREEKKKNSSDDVNMDGKSSEEKLLVDSKSANKGLMSHYAKAAFGDFLDAKCLYLSFKCEILCDAGDIERAKECMDDLKSEIFEGSRVLVRIGAKVFSWYHAAEMILYESCMDAAKFYKAGVNYFAYTPLETARRDFKNLEHLAIKVGFAALLAPGEYPFGQLLELPLFKNEDSVKSSWIYELIFAFQEGSHDLYDQVKAKHGNKIKEASTNKNAAINFPIVGNEENEVIVSEKFHACVLLEFAFKQPKAQRKLKLSKLQDIIRINDVETLLINSMCANLIKGSINQCEGTFTYTWVRPRVLDLPRLGILEDRIGDWIMHQKAVLSRIEEMTPELLVTV